MELTQHTMRCPLEECSATVTVRKDPDRYSSSRHLDVTARSLRPSTSSVLPARRAHLPDATPPVSYVREADPTPYHSLPVECAKPCLAVLNAAKPGATEPVRCTSGVADGLELVRQTHSPAITRVLWLYSV